MTTTSSDKRVAAESGTLTRVGAAVTLKTTRARARMTVEAFISVLSVIFFKKKG